MVQNYEASISEDDFFGIVDVGFDHDAGLVLIEDAYTSNELSSLENVRTRRGRLDRSESLKDIFRVLWNYGDSREKCKAVLRGICDYTIRDIGRIDRDDVYRQRLSALKRTAIRRCGRA